MALLDDLKGKYQPAIELLQEQGIKLANLHVQDGKLFIKGFAPSLEAANKIWDALKRINPKLDDVIADFPVDPSRAAAPKMNLYLVKPGDTLSSIAKQFYGNANDYMKIFNANKDLLKDPNKIMAGQELKIPA